MSFVLRRAGVVNVDYLDEKAQNYIRNRQIKMNFNQNSAIERARQDLAGRLSVSENEIELISVSETEFPDASLGAPVDDEMSAQMISSGWQVTLRAKGKTYDYRADKYQLRLSNYDGKNHVIEM